MKRWIKAFSVLPVFFAASAAIAQESDLNGRAAEVQERPDEVWTGGDAEAMLTLFAKDAIYWPLTGGTFEGPDEIRSQIEQEQMVTTSVEVTSMQFERLNGIVFALGTFTATMSEEAGGETRGEYVILAEDADEGVSVRRLIAFPARQDPEEPRSA